MKIKPAATVWLREEEKCVGLHAVYTRDQLLEVIEQCAKVIDCFDSEPISFNSAGEIIRKLKEILL